MRAVGDISLVPADPLAMPSTVNGAGHPRLEAKRLLRKILFLICGCYYDVLYTCLRVKKHRF